MKKRFLACGLCALMLLSAVRASAVRGEDVFHDDSVVRSVTTVVYCLSEDRYRLVPEVRTIQILGGETLLSVLANEVLQPSVSDNLVSAMSERARFAVLSVMQTGRVATVDLGGDADLLQIYELFCLKAALVNTLIETGLVDYVNVLIGGREVPTNDLPTGTMTRFSEDLQSAWVEHENEGVASLRSTDYTFKRDVTLYFTNTESNLMLAEVRQLTFTRSDLASPVIRALISGPSNSSSLRRSYPSSAQIVGTPSIEAEDGSNSFLDVSFSYEMASVLGGTQRVRRATLAPLVITLTSFLPETDAVCIRVNRRPLDSLIEEDGNGRMLYREQFEGYIGRTVELYFPNGDGTLAKVTRAVPQNLSTLRDLAEQLFIIPEGVLPAFPEGVASQHLLGAFMMDDTAVLNLSREGAELFAGLDADQERACIFSIVNTLTGYDGVSRVQFLVEGRRVRSLANVISVHGPLVRNPGVVNTALN